MSTRLWPNPGLTQPLLGSNLRRRAERAPRIEDTQTAFVGAVPRICAVAAAAFFGLKLFQAAAPQYRWPIVVVTSVVLVQGLLVRWLVVEHRRRQDAEQSVFIHETEARQHLATVAHLNRLASVGQITAAIAHELSQPLEAILHNAEAGEMLLESGRLTEDDMRELLGDIRRIDMRASDIVRRMRTLLCKHEIQTQAVDVNDLARETAAIAASAAKSNDVRVEFALQSGIGVVPGDRLYLQQVLLNLLLNGIDAMAGMPRDARRLVVSTKVREGGVEVSVRDAGHGIPPAAVTKIFEPFYTTKGTGMGMGLSIARSIIEAHGGRISARNNEDIGATVSVTLPVTEAA